LEKTLKSFDDIFDVYFDQNQSAPEHPKGNRAKIIVFREEKQAMETNGCEVWNGGRKVVRRKNNNFKLEINKSFGDGQANALARTVGRTGIRGPRITDIETSRGRGACRHCLGHTQHKQRFLSVAFASLALLPRSLLSVLGDLFKLGENFVMVQ
jgi:hypothetical protein